MLAIVAVASFAIGQVATGIFVAWSRDVQRRHGLEPGAEGPGKRRGALAAPGAARPGPALGERRGDRLPGPRAGRRRVARGGRPGAGRRAAHLRGDARGAGGRAHRRERAGAQGHEPDRRWRRRARRPHEHGVPEHAGHPRLRFHHRDRDRSGDADGPHRRHGHRDEALSLAAAAGARRPDQDLRPPRLVGRGGHRHRGHRARPGTETRCSCCASRPRSRRSPSACRRSCRRCCRRGHNAWPSRRRSSSR